MESTAAGDDAGAPRGAPPATGPRVGPYLLGRRLGAGGMGAVYEGVHERTGARRAVKTILVRPDERPEDLARFRREAALTSRLTHPNIVRIHEVGLDRPPFFIAMDLVDGASLQARLDREGPLPVAQAVEVAIKLAGALAHAHAHGVVHRDIKPLNVMLDASGEPRLLDFGLARAAGALVERLTLTGEVVGTPRYVAPEQVMDARSVDGRADVYGLGGVLYAMLTGKPPIPGTHVTEVLINVQTHLPPRASSLRPEVSPALDEVCARALAKEPDARHASALDLLEALREAGKGRRRRTRPGGRRARRLALAGLGLGAALALALAGVAATTARPPAPPSDPALADGAAAVGAPAGPTTAAAPAPLAPPPDWSVGELEGEHHLLTLTLWPDAGPASAGASLLVRCLPGPTAGHLQVRLDRVQAWAGGERVARLDEVGEQRPVSELEVALARLVGGAATYRIAPGAIEVSVTDSELVAACAGLRRVVGAVPLDRALALGVAALLEPPGWSAALTAACGSARGEDGGAVVELPSNPDVRLRALVRLEGARVHVAREVGLGAVREALGKPRLYDAATLWLINGLRRLGDVRPGELLVAPRPTVLAPDGALAGVEVDRLPAHAAPFGPVVAVLRRGAQVGAHARRGRWRQVCHEGAEVWVEADGLGAPAPGAQAVRITPAGGFGSDWAVASPSPDRSAPGLGYAPDHGVFRVLAETPGRAATPRQRASRYLEISYAGERCWILEVDTERAQ